jgi:hypothetical protein
MASWLRFGADCLTTTAIIIMTVIRQLHGLAVNCDE